MNSLTNLLNGNTKDYQKLVSVGDGRFSKVYKTIHKETKKEVVIKIQKKGKDNHELMTDEIKLMKCLKNGSDFVIKCYDTFRVKANDGERICIVLEPMEHDLLKIVDAKERPSISEVKSMIKQVLQGIEYIHSRSMIHTDLKPENVLKKEEHVKVGDLGSACWTDKQFSDSIGTTEYRAPESIIGMDYNAKVDIWAVACLTFELLTGDYLFDPHAYV